MKLLIESVEVARLNLNKEWTSRCVVNTFVLSLDGSLTIKFQSSGDFSQFLNKDGTLKRRILTELIGIAVLNQSIEL